MPDAIRALLERDLTGLDGPPTDLERVAARLGVGAFVVAEDLLGSGELRQTDEGLVILYAHDLVEPRRRFTIAHELGHALIFRVTGATRQAGMEVERLCDMIAAEILMPKQQFWAHQVPPTSLRKIRALSHVFRVSVQAAAKRCSELAGITVFSAESGSITWTCGRVKRGPITAVEEPLRQGIDRALHGESGEEFLYFDGSFQQWRFEYQPLTSGGAWFLLEPLRRGLHFDLGG